MKYPVSCICNFFITCYCVISRFFLSLVLYLVMLFEFILQGSVMKCPVSCNCVMSCLDGLLSSHVLYFARNSSQPNLAQCLYLYISIIVISAFILVSVLALVSVFVLVSVHILM